MKIGLGYDVHKLVKNKPLILGGVKINHEKGLLGHSDADVLVHSIMDALLGAACLGDIGSHFPDTDSKYKDISSLILLEKVNTLIKEKNYSIVNIDCCIVAQRPKIFPYISEIKKHICSRLNISNEQLNIKATTEEGLGFTGNEKGISCKSICLLN